MNLYDFDKTIYRYDSTRKFYFFIIKKYPKLWWHTFKVGFFGLGKVLKIIPLKKFKEKFFSIVQKLPNLEEDVKEFWDKEIININDWYFDKRKKDDVICSATPHFLLDEIVKRINISATLVCSFVSPKTGLFEKNTENCRDKEKVKRLKALNFTHFNEGYSDSTSDVPMLKMCKKRFRVKDGKLSVFEEKYFKEKDLDKKKK